MTHGHRRWLERKLTEADDEINAAYWRFTRCAQAKPPVMVCPDAYRRRALIRRLLAR